MGDSLLKKSQCNQWGESILVVERQGKLHVSNLKFQVVKGVHKSLLSTEPYEQLELIKVDLTPAE